MSRSLFSSLRPEIDRMLCALGLPQDGGYTRPVSPEEQALMEKWAGKGIPLCSVRGCDNIAGHDDEHGPIRFFGEPTS